MILGLSISLLVVRSGEDEVLERAATAFKTQTSYRTQISIVTKTPAPFGLQMTGAVDQRTKVAEFQMHFTYPGTARTVTCGLVSTADAVYIPVKAKNRPKFGGKQWVRSPVAGLLPIQGFGTRGFDPKTFADIHDVHRSGTGVVRGVTTTTYDGTLHIDRTKLRQDASSVPSETPVKLWVSSDNLIRRLEESVVTKQNNLTVTTRSTFDYFDFGVPVHLVAPAPSQVDHGDAQAAILACLS